MGVGLETPMINQQTSQVLFLATHDGLQGKPKGSCNPVYPSVDLENLKYWNVEHQNNVRAREDNPDS